MLYNILHRGKKVKRRSVAKAIPHYLRAERKPKKIALAEKGPKITAADVRLIDYDLDAENNEIIRPAIQVSDPRELRRAFYKKPNMPISRAEYVVFRERMRKVRRKYREEYLDEQAFQYAKFKSRHDGIQQRKFERFLQKKWRQMEPKPSIQRHEGRENTMMAYYHSLRLNNIIVRRKIEDHWRKYRIATMVKPMLEEARAGTLLMGVEDVPRVINAKFLDRIDHYPGLPESGFFDTPTGLYRTSDHVFRSFAKELRKSLNPRIEGAKKITNTSVNPYKKYIVDHRNLKPDQRFAYLWSTYPVSYEVGPDGSRMVYPEISEEDILTNIEKIGIKSWKDIGTIPKTELVKNPRLTTFFSEADITAELRSTYEEIKKLQDLEVLYRPKTASILEGSWEAE